MCSRVSLTLIVLTLGLKSEFAFETAENDPFNPDIWRKQEFGHKISQAPEAHAYVNRDLIDDQVLSPANVSITLTGSVSGSELTAKLRSVASASPCGS